MTLLKISLWWIWYFIWFVLSTVLCNSFFSFLPIILRLSEYDILKYNDYAFLNRSTIYMSKQKKFTNQDDLAEKDQNTYNALLHQYNYTSWNEYQKNRERYSNTNIFLIKIGLILLCTSIIITIFFSNAHYMAWWRILLRIIIYFVSINILLKIIQKQDYEFSFIKFFIKDQIIILFMLSIDLFMWWFVRNGFERYLNSLVTIEKKDENNYIFHTKSKHNSKEVKSFIEWQLRLT